MLKKDDKAEVTNRHKFAKNKLRKHKKYLNVYGLSILSEDEINKYRVWVRGENKYFLVTIIKKEHINSEFDHTKDALEDIVRKQKNDPMMVGKYKQHIEGTESRHKKITWWMYKDDIYWEDEEHTQTEVKALIFEKERKKRRQLDKAIAIMEQEETARLTKSRESIPDEVKIFVWQRDGGKCVNCSTNKTLEFDHIIPIALGGSNSARNLQILCENCNRSKGASIV